MRQEAEGICDKTKFIAEGDAYQNREVGKAIAQAYEAQSNVIGPQILGTLKAFKEIADGNIKITPDVLVTGGADGGNLINALLAMLIKEGALNLPKTVTKKLSKTKEEALPSVPIEKTEIQDQSVDENEQEEPESEDTEETSSKTTRGRRR
jgi:hypothetical protein